MDTIAINADPIWRETEEMTEKYEMKMKAKEKK